MYTLIDYQTVHIVHSSYFKVNRNWTGVVFFLILTHFLCLHRNIDMIQLFIKSFQKFWAGASLLLGFAFSNCLKPNPINSQQRHQIGFWKVSLVSDLPVTVFKWDPNTNFLSILLSFFSTLFPPLSTYFVNTPGPHQQPKKIIVSHFLIFLIVYITWMLLNGYGDKRSPLRNLIFVRFLYHLWQVLNGVILGLKSELNQSTWLQKLKPFGSYPRISSIRASYMAYNIFQSMITPISQTPTYPFKIKRFI